MKHKIRIDSLFLVLGWLGIGPSWAQNPAYDPPTGYYDSATGLTRTALKAALHEIIDDHVRFPYTSSSTDTWNILRDSDQDPNNPANVILVYNGASVNGAQEYNSGNGWNREHVWPQSLGGFDTSNPGPGTDCHNLRACHGWVNSTRSNLEFDNGGSPVTGEGLTDTFKDSNSFEPNPVFKGDVARIIFYMAVRYEGGDSEPNLEIDDFTNGGTYSFGKLSTLLLWHALDPVDEFERRRNSRIASYQQNRNPFIDHPEYAEAIWGAQLITPTISWNVPSPIPYGTPLGTTQLNATSSVAGTFVYTPTSGTILNAGTNTLKVVLTTTQAGYVSPVTNTVNLVVAKANPTISSAPTATTILVGQALSASQLSGGVASVAGSFAWTAPTTLPPAGTNHYAVTFSPANGANYNPATTTVSVMAQTPLEAWAAGYGLTEATAAAGADPDGDGLANLAEYALAGVPTNSSTSILPVVSTLTTNGTNWLRFAYRARTNDAALVIQPVFKVNLTETNWSTNGVVQKVSGQPAGDGVHEDQVWQTPVGAEARRFLKLNISR